MWILLRSTAITLINSKQISNTATLSQIASITNTNLNNILNNINDCFIPPLHLSNDNSVIRKINIGSLELVNRDTRHTRLSYPIGGTVVPSFNSGSITLPAISGGTIVITPGSNTAMPNIGASKFLKVGISLSNSGTILVQFGTAGNTELLATMPATQSPVAIDIGYITVSTDSSSNVNTIANNKVYQYTGSVAQNAGSIPPASILVDGYVTTIAQSFAGDKTFLGNTAISNNLIVTGKINNNIQSVMRSLYNFPISGIVGAWTLGASLLAFGGSWVNYKTSAVINDHEIFILPGAQQSYSGTTTHYVRYNFKTDTVAAYGPSFATIDAEPFAGAILLPDGRVFGAPGTYAGPCVFNLVTNTLEGAAFPDGAYRPNFTDAVLLPNGKVFCIAGKYTGTRNIYNPMTNTWDNGPGGPPSVQYSLPGIAFAAGVLLPNGKVFCVPYSYTGSMNIYNPSTNAWEAGVPPPYGVQSALSGGTLMPNGKVLCTPSSLMTVRLVYNYLTNAWEDTGPTGNIYGRNAGILLPNGKVFCLSGNTTTSTITTYNPITNLWEPGGPVALGNSVCGAGRLLPDGRIIFIPSGATNIAYYNPNCRDWPYGTWMLHPMFSSGGGLG